MASSFPKDYIQNLKILIHLCKTNPNLLHTSELDFFKSYIESLGGTVPAKKAEEEKSKPEPKAPEVEETDSGESDLELDFEGVIECDNDPPQPMGDCNKEITEEDIDKSDEKKQEAIKLSGQQKYEEAILIFTEAISLNPNSALLYAKRGQCYLQLQKPNACIRDCNRALEINPDYAAAYKFRGRAHRLIGNFLKSAEDLRMACKIDYDEQADQWLKEVTPNARKLEEHQRKYERKKLEKDLKDTRERIRKMKEEQQKRTTGSNKSDADIYGHLGDFIKLFQSDPELMSDFKDPEVVSAFNEVSQNLGNLEKYQNNPRIREVMEKVCAKMRNSSLFEDMPGFLPGFPRNLSEAFSARAQNNPAPQPAPQTGSDLDLD